MTKAEHVQSLLSASLPGKAPSRFLVEGANLPVSISSMPAPVTALFFATPVFYYLLAFCLLMI
jgi:hypothetical protein